jgi:hypothetical protein
LPAKSLTQSINDFRFLISSAVDCETCLLYLWFLRQCCHVTTIFFLCIVGPFFHLLVFNIVMQSTFLFTENYEPISQGELCEVWGYHGGKDRIPGFLDCCAVCNVVVGYHRFGRSCCLCQPRMWRQQGLPKRWYPATTLHGSTIQKSMNSEGRRD